MEVQPLGSLDNLVSVLDETNSYFRRQVQKQVNVALTLRNWLFGLYIVEYELNGLDRATYGKQLFKEIAKRSKHIKGISESNLYIYKQFYQTYPQIFQTVSGKFQVSDFNGVIIFQTVSGKLEKENKQTIQSVTEQFKTDPNLLINRLSFSHIIELLKGDNLIKRTLIKIV
jgi:hypothetical protein